MSDRLTQLQDTVNQQAENFCNAVGVIQQTSIPSKFNTFDRAHGNTRISQDNYSELFAQSIARCAKDIDMLIESLPNEDNSLEIQNQSLKWLEVQNQQAGERLDVAVREGDVLLGKLQSALEDIARSQLDIHVSMTT